MPRLPVVGGDSGGWGSILNEFLAVSLLSSDGTLRLVTNAPAGSAFVVPTAFTDSSVQTAINTANSAGGGTVLLPRGAYVKAGATWATITMKDHVRLVGPLGPLGERTGQAGKGAVFLNNDAVNTMTYATSGDASLSTIIEGVSFEGTGAGAHIAVPSGSNRLWIRGNSFSGKANGVKITDSVYQIWVEKNTFYNHTSHHLYITGTAGPGPGLYIRDNYWSVLAAGARHLYYDNSVSAAVVEITGNTFAGPVSGAALMEIAGGGVRAFVIALNDFENFAGQTALIVSGTGGGVEYNAISNGAVGISLVAGNNIVIGANRLGSLTGNALTIDGSSNSVVVLPNSGLTPVSDSGVGTVWFTRPLDESANLGITSGGAWRQRAGVGIDVNNQASFADGIVGRGAGSGVDYYAGGSVIMRHINGVQVGGPIGGDKGAGTINAAGAYYANGSSGVTKTGVTSTFASMTITNGIITAVTT